MRSDCSVRMAVAAGGLGIWAETWAASSAAPRPRCSARRTLLATSRGMRDEDDSDQGHLVSLADEDVSCLSVASLRVSRVASHAHSRSAVWKELP
jgi:hypothetical protein